LLPSPQREADELIRLTEALAGMPEQQRRALLLREWQGLSYKEIAEELELSQAAVETLLFRARRSLAQGLTEEPKEPKEPVRKEKGLRGRLRAGGDMGSVAAVVKTLFFSGGAKLAATVATVAATSIVAATPAVRHEVVNVVSPPAHHVAPAARAEGKAAPAAALAASSAPAVAAEARPEKAQHVTANARPAAPASRHGSKTTVHHTVAPASSATQPATAPPATEPATPSAAPAPAEQAPPAAA